MFMKCVAVSLMSTSIVAALAAQSGQPAPAKGVLHDITVTADDVYTGTITLDVTAGKVTGRMLLTAPTGVTGDVAGTAKEGALVLEFPFHMTAQECDGVVRMNLQVPATPGPTKGTMEAVGCGRDESNKITGTVELKPAAQKPGAGR